MDSRKEVQALISKDSTHQLAIQKASVIKPQQALPVTDAILRDMLRHISRSNHYQPTIDFIHLALKILNRAYELLLLASEMKVLQLTNELTPLKEQLLPELSNLVSGITKVQNVSDITSYLVELKVWLKALYVHAINANDWRQRIKDYIFFQITGLEAVKVAKYYDDAAEEISKLMHSWEKKENKSRLFTPANRSQTTYYPAGDDQNLSGAHAPSHQRFK